MAFSTLEARLVPMPAAPSITPTTEADDRILHPLNQMLLCSMDPLDPLDRLVRLVRCYLKVPLHPCLLDLLDQSDR